MDDKREVEYWIGRQFRGRGIATKALEQLPGLVLVRPLYGVVARHNIGSQRVQEKFGIIRSREAAEDVTFILA